MNLDHTMPLVYLYNLDETATCLCAECNSKKSDIFPINFYSNKQLISLSKKTGLEINILKSVSPNNLVIKALKEKIIWFIDVFLADDKYTKVRDGKKTSDSILHSIQKMRNTQSIENHYNYLGQLNKQTYI